MTDTEITKAFEICYVSDEGCSGCPFCDEDGECTDIGDSNLCQDVLDLINRQQAEIERKTKLIADITDEYAKFKEAAKKQEIAKVKHIQQVADEEISRLRVEAEGLKAQSELWYSKYKSLENDRRMLEGHRYSFHNGKLTMIPKTEEKIIKDRAIKEVIARVKKEATLCCKGAFELNPKTPYGGKSEIIKEYHITEDKLKAIVKEMVGEDK